MKTLADANLADARTAASSSPLSSLSNSEAPITIAGIATAVPEHVFGRDEAKVYLNKVFTLSESRTNLMLDVISNLQIERRHCTYPVDYLIEPRPLGQITLEYKEHAIVLAKRAAVACLERAGLEPSDIDLLITVSCTGVLLPSTGAHLVNEMGFRSDVRRMPITELGCAGGAAALGRAWDYLRGVREGNVLLIAVELPSLTFQRRDVSIANMISAVLFGDGAAAVALTRRADPADAASAGGDGFSRPQLVDVHSHLFPNSLTALGFDLKETGFHIVLSKDMPELIRGAIQRLLDELIGRYGLTSKDITAYILHPGGRKLLECIEEELGLSREQTQPSWDVLRSYGNQSSASVLFVLHEWITKAQMSPGDLGFLAAFGPGFSTDMALLRWV